jgi:methylmalonyl-CoA mutase N-terminal domain/subunit
LASSRSANRVRAVRARGIAVDRFAPRIAILVNCSMDFFEEIAKIRATRRLYAKMMKKEFGAGDPRSLSVVITSHTSGLTLSAQQPINNVIRGTTQGVALALAGVQAMEISAFDEGFRTPSAEAHLTAIRTQQILSIETGIAKVADPLGGSYFIESLTDEIEARISTMVGEIEAAGDPIELAERGYFRAIFNRASERHARALASGEHQIVGVNRYEMSRSEDTLLRDIAERKIAPYREQIEKVRRFRAERDQEPVRRALRHVHAQAKIRDANLVPAVLAGLQAGATMGELAGAMRLAYDTPYDPLGVLQPDF